MPIIQPVSNPVTTTDFQNIAASQIRTISTNLLIQMTKGYRHIFSLIWQHPTLTPQQVFDALGSDAVQLLTLGLLLQSTILEAQPSILLPVAPNATTINKDGTIVVGDPIPTIDPVSGVDTNLADTNPTLLSKIKDAWTSIIQAAGLGQ